MDNLIFCEWMYHYKHHHLMFFTLFDQSYCSPFANHLVRLLTILWFTQWKFRFWASRVILFLWSWMSILSNAIMNPGCDTFLRSSNSRCAFRILSMQLLEEHLAWEAWVDLMVSRVSSWSFTRMFPWVIFSLTFSRAKVWFSPRQSSFASTVLFEQVIFNLANLARLAYIIKQRTINK